MSEWRAVRVRALGRPATESVASGLSPPYFRDVRYRGVAMRLYTMRLPSSSDGLVRTARALTEANATIARVRWLLLGLTLGGALAAALLGRLAANAVLRPVRALAGAVREVSATRDLNQRIPVSGRDELASLAADFNAMLAALDESQHAQQQLIADASHELRTPLTAHRANIELLARPDLPVERRQRVLGAAVRVDRGALDAWSAISSRPPATAGLSTHASRSRSTSSWRRRSSGRSTGRRGCASRAGWSPTGSSAPARGSSARSTTFSTTRSSGARPGGTIEIRLVDGTLTVRDHGPGIAEADLPHVFDRFYRAAAARALPGSGLGLAIVEADRRRPRRQRHRRQRGRRRGAPHAPLRPRPISRSLSKLSATSQPRAPTRSGLGDELSLLSSERNRTCALPLSTHPRLPSPRLPRSRCSRPAVAAAAPRRRERRLLHDERRARPRRTARRRHRTGRSPPRSPSPAACAPTAYRTGPTPPAAG